MRGKWLSERTMGIAKLDILIDYYLGDTNCKRCNEDSVSTNRLALGRFARAIDLNSHLTQPTAERPVGRYERPL